MKTKIFNKYAKDVARVYNIAEEDVFKKSKKRECVDARQTLYYLCHKRPMRTTYIRDYMEINGYEVGHSSIHYNLKQAKKRMEEDSDYRYVVNSLQ